MGTSFLSLFFNIKKSVRSSHTPSPQRTVCTLVKMMIIMEEPLRGVVEMSEIVILQLNTFIRFLDLGAYFPIHRSASLS